MLPATWLIGWPSILCFQFVGSTGKLVQGEPECSSDAVSDIPRGVGDATLEARIEVTSMFAASASAS